MIPLPVNIPWRLIGAGVLVAVVALAGWRVNSWRQDSLALAAAKAETAEIAAQAKAAMATLAEAHSKALNASQGLQDELQTLRANRGKSRVVRLCNDVPAGPAQGAGAAGRDGAAPGAGELQTEAGPDIGGRLYDLADDADELAARLRACQSLLR